MDCSDLGEPVYVDRDMWEKVVLNLISNAFKFTFEGEIAVSLRRNDNVAELRVRDTGVGIPADAIPKLFERFNRVPNMPSRTHEGSGIGLALVYELVKLHGGSVRAESTVGQGSTLVISPRVNHAVQTGFRRRNPDGPAERLERHAPAGSEQRGRHALSVVIPDVQSRVGKLVSEQTEAGNVCRPAPSGWPKIEQRNFQHVTGHRPIDVDRAGDRIGAPEIQLHEIA